MKIGLYILILLNQVHLKNAKESEKSEKSQETRKYHINDMYPNDPKELWGLKVSKNIFFPILCLFRIMKVMVNQ